ncbi:PefC/AfrB family outer membrane usher protein [Vibrio harveyi]
MKMKLTRLTLGIVVALHGAGVCAEEFDLSFLQGGAKIAPSLLESLSSEFVPGRYLVDVDLNDRAIGKSILTITSQDKEMLCLSEAWLREAGVAINPEFYTHQFNKARQCYVLANEPNSKVDFDFSTQSIKFMIPQKGLAKRELKLEDWNYGMSALRMNYNANMSVNDVDTTVYSSVGMKANVGRWVATTSVGISENSVDVPMITATRALYDLKADLTLGKTFVGNSLVGGAGLLGIGLASNSSMLANNIGYTPVFSGIANSHARITLTQNGSTVYSEIVPPGPFEITNASLLSSGDVTMTITERDGTKRTQLFPLTIVPNMLNPGESEYSVYAGLRDNGMGGNLDGLFTAGSFGYGFDDYTLKGSALLHTDYAAAGMDLVRGLGEWGTLATEAAYSYTRYDNNTSRSGGKFSLTYSKAFNEDTNLQVIGAQYTSRDYVEFSEFSPWEMDEQSESKQKTQYELSLSHRITERLSSSLSAWHRIYWGDRDTSSGASLNLSSSFEYFSSSLGATYSESGDNQNYAVSLSVSVPLDAFGQKFSSYGSVNITGEGEQSYNTGISSNIGDKFNYSAGMGWSSSEDDKSYSLQSSYQGERALLNGQLSSNGGRLTGSASVSGSVIVLPEQRDVLFTRDISDTIVIASVKDAAGVEFTSSPYPTNNKGNAVIPMSSYGYNRVTLDGSTLPLNIELLTTDQTVVPTAGAVVHLPFKAVEVKRYLFQVRQKNGEFVPNGTWATSSTGVPLGFIAQNGVLFVNSVDELEGLRLGECVIKGSSIRDTDKLQEVVCDD